MNYEEVRKKLVQEGYSTAIRYANGSVAVELTAMNNEHTINLIINKDGDIPDRAVYYAQS